MPDLNSRPKPKDGKLILKKSVTCTAMPGTCKLKILMLLHLTLLPQHPSNLITQIKFSAHTEMLLKLTKISEMKLLVKS